MNGKIIYPFPEKQTKTHLTKSKRGESVIILTEESFGAHLWAFFILCHHMSVFSVMVIHFLENPHKHLEHVNVQNVRVTQWNRHSSD